MPGTKRIKPSIELAQSFAVSKKGKCLSTECLSAKDMLRWSCENDLHEWQATYDSVKCGSWCPDCNGNKKLTIEDVHKTAKEREGFCLSTEYINSKSPLNWKCKNGHTWFQMYEAVRAGTWCGKCHAPGLNQTIEDMKDLACSRGGYCISENYVNARSKLSWQCGLKHSIWKATPDDIKRGRWCPDCQSGLGERICRKYLETIFKSDFIKERPDFLRNNETGQNLELDGYCSSLRIAFEHHGRQHFTANSYFSQTETALKKRNDYDELKRMKCNELGIRLIEIPSIPDMLPFSKIEEYFKKEFKRLDLNPSLVIPISEINFTDAFSPDMTYLLNEMNELASDKGGRCLSNLYLGYHGKIKWQCQFNHPVWEASPAKIKDGRWCPTCSGRIKKTIEEVSVFARSRGFKLISSEYINTNSKLVWECTQGHHWSASYDSVSRGSGCSVCHSIWKKSGYKTKNPRT